jgi:hypothetical protein
MLSNLWIHSSRVPWALDHVYLFGIWQRSVSPDLHQWNYCNFFYHHACKPNIISIISYLSVRKQLDKYALIDYSFIEPPLFEENYMDVRLKVGHIIINICEAFVLQLGSDLYLCVCSIPTQGISECNFAWFECENSASSLALTNSPPVFSAIVVTKLVNETQSCLCEILMIVVSFLYRI